MFEGDMRCLMCWVFKEKSMLTRQNFFTLVKSKLAAAAADGDHVDTLQRVTLDKAQENGLGQQLQQAKRDLDAALCDSFNTPDAMRVILQLIRSANIELAKKDKTAAADLRELEEVARWVTKVVGIFGLDAYAKPPYDGLGWAVAGTDASAEEVARPYADVYARVRSDVAALQLPDADETLRTLLAQSPDAELAELEAAGERNPEALALPHVRATSRIRDALRRLVPTLTAANEDKSLKSRVLGLCDRIRDEDLTLLGVQLDDATDGSSPSQIKFVPAEKLLAAQREKRELAEQRRWQKEEQQRKREREEAARWEKAKLSPADMFKTEEAREKYAAWDEDGVPTRTAGGEEVAKSQVKKLRKEWEKQKKLHDEWLGRMRG